MGGTGLEPVTPSLVEVGATCPRPTGSLRIMVLSRDFFSVLQGRDVRRNAAFCAPAVGHIVGMELLLVLQTSNVCRTSGAYASRLDGFSGWGRRAERREADAGAGGLLRAAGRGGSRRLLRGPGRVAGTVGGKRRLRARARWRGRGRRAGDAASGRRPGERDERCGRRCGSGRSRSGRSTSRAASGGRSRSGSRRSPGTTSSSRARRASASCTR